MAVSRKEILPETTVELQDIEMWIDTELNKSANQEILKKHGILILIDYNTTAEKDNYGERAVIRTHPIYNEIAKLYITKGWKFDYNLGMNYTIISLS